MTHNGHANPAKWAGIEPPKGQILGWKVVRPDGKTHGDYQWPLMPRVVRCDAIKFTRGEPCPSFAGDGLCIARTWQGAASGGLTAITGLALSYYERDVLGSDEHKVRVSKCKVLAVLDLQALLRTHGNAADLRGASLYGADLYGANLYGANLYVANLYGANLREADLRAANLRAANLTGANLTGASLYRANLSGANLTGASLYRANLSGANLYRANLSGADLRGASLYRANLSGANLTGANLTGANLTGAIGYKEA